MFLPRKDVFGGDKVIKLKHAKPKRKMKKSMNCFECIHSYRSSITTGQQDGRLICSKWGCVVFLTHAKICPHFTPVTVAKRREKRRREVMR